MLILVLTVMDSHSSKDGQFGMVGYLCMKIYFNKNGHFSKVPGTKCQQDLTIFPCKIIRRDLYLSAEILARILKDSKEFYEK
jgi:hypothetical protein